MGRFPVRYGERRLLARFVAILRWVGFAGSSYSLIKQNLRCEAVGLSIARRFAMLIWGNGNSHLVLNTKNFSES